MGKYRRKGEWENSECDYCETPIWVRTGTYTMYHGLEHFYGDIKIKDPCSFSVLDEKDASKGIACVSCFKKRFKDES